MKRTVYDLMKQRNISHPPVINESADIKSALKKLEEVDVGALLVLSSGTVVGMFSERDFARAYVSKGGELAPTLKVKDLMRSKMLQARRKLQP